MATDKQSLMGATLGATLGATITKKTDYLYFSQLLIVTIR
jgi:hypothetical protein